VPAEVPREAAVEPDNATAIKSDLKTNTYEKPAVVVPETAAARVDAQAATATAAASGATLLENRLAATTAWLNSADPQTYTIQLMGSKDDQQLNQHLKFLANIIEINSLFVYRTTAKGEPSLTVVWGSFDSQREAREAMAKLPPFLKAYRPLLRTVPGIKAEIRERTAS
jgi:septal ring-binding cell division protein DamX